MTELIVKREPHIEGGILGRLSVEPWPAGAPGERIALYTLERLEVAIPAGRYSLALRHSPRFNRILPRLGVVPGRSGILIHAGNTTSHTQGCILVGQAVVSLPGRAPELRRSRDALEALMVFLRWAGSGVWITVR